LRRVFTNLCQVIDWWSETATIFHLWISPPDVILSDKTWVYSHDIEIKQQSSHWKSPASPHPKKARQTYLHVNSVLPVLFDHRDTVQYDWTPEGQTVNQDFIKQCAGCGSKKLTWNVNWEAGSSMTIMHLFTWPYQTVFGKIFNGYPSTTPSPHAPHFSPPDFCVP
jgi:hypothetical protein